MLWPSLVIFRWYILTEFFVTELPYHLIGVLIEMDPFQYGLKYTVE
jgi:hypothetical protein